MYVIETFSGMAKEQGSLLLEVNRRVHQLIGLRMLHTFALCFHGIVLGLKNIVVTIYDPFCGLVVRVPGYRSRGPGFDARHYQIF
jgi:hypothetical protein